LQYFAQRNSFRLVVTIAKQAAFEAIEARKLFCTGQVRMIGNVVRNADEFIERQNDRPVPPLDQPGRNREILVLRALSGSKLATARHCKLGAS
jgi:hypothetical protein